ncbi:MAG: tetratricopeptide repeat protein [Gammaproteobacteria bacterium]|nr:tetratricopeptide repeat protein [Gammaproteobacteria bacterium]
MLLILGLILLQTLALTGCGGSATRPAPVTDSAVEGAGQQEQQAQTFGYVDSGFSGFGQAQVYASQSPNPQRALPQEAELKERAPANEPSSNTVLALMQTAEGQEQAGNLAGAAATLERALRVQPRNAVLWYQLANVRFKQGQYARANSLAGKSNALAGSNPSLRRNNWLLIAKIKRAQGDEYGAREAEIKAREG